MTTRKWKTELLVNTTVTGNQDQPAVTALADGGFVIAWRDDGPADSLIRWQRYDAAGVKSGLEQTANAGQGLDQTNPAVVALQGDQLWFVQQDFDSSTDRDIVGTVVTASGTVVRAQDSNGGGLDHVDPAAASLGANGAVSVYVRNFYDAFNVFVQSDIVMTRFDINGASAGEVTVNTNPGTLAANQTEPQVAASRDGSKFAVVWTDFGLTGGDIRARVFDNTGAQFAAEFTVNSVTDSTQQGPKVAWLDNGRFVVTWTSFDSAPSADTDVNAVKYAIYSASGVLQGAERLANSTVIGSQEFSAITALPDGGFVIAFRDFSATGGDTSASAIRLQAFDGAGDKRGGEILVNTTTLLDQGDVELAALADGRVVVTWRDNSASGGDTSGRAIRAQIVDPRDGIIDGTSGVDKLYGHDAVGDVITGFGGADTIDGLAGADVIDGGDGADQIFGGRGDDTLYGGADADMLMGGLGADDIFGDVGNDTITFVQSRAGVTVNLLTGEGFGAEAEGDSYFSIETVRGSNFGDTLIASNLGNTLSGFAGVDTLTGGTSADTFNGGDGADIINGGGGTDIAFYSSTSAAITINLFTNANTGGEALGDVLTSVEQISGTSQGDTIFGNGLANTFFGGLGNDRLGGGTGVDTLISGGGSDTFVFALGDTGQALATAEIALDYTKGIVGTGDKFDFTSALTVGGVATAATATQASINATTGVATFFAGSGTTMADALADIATSLTTGGNSVGEFALFRVNNAGNFFQFISDGVAGVGANDVLVDLRGITTINTINLTAGDLTILT